MRGKQRQGEARAQLCWQSNLELQACKSYAQLLRNLLDLLCILIQQGTEMRIPYTITLQHQQGTGKLQPCPKTPQRTAAQH